MTGPEKGFLLLTSSLGDPQRKPLTTAQFRKLAKRVQQAEWDATARDLEPNDLIALGYAEPMAQRIYGLLHSANQLREYLQRAQNCGCYPITRLNPLYPAAVRQRLGLDSPGVLWAKGDTALLGKPAVAVIGRRDLNEENRAFAIEAGRQAALQGAVLVSGNARGADQAAQEACLGAGGQVISVIADSLQKQPLRDNVLYLSLDDFDQGFSARRALQRNYVIHTMASLVIAAQSSLGKGGTWDGTLTNLSRSWTPVCVFADGSDAAAELESCGARLINREELRDLSVLAEQIRFL